jgi:hypothetical protein
MELLEPKLIRPRQVRYQAALRPDPTSGRLSIMADFGNDVENQT